MATFRQHFFALTKTKCLSSRLLNVKRGSRKLKTEDIYFEDMLTDHINEIVQGHTLYRLKCFCKQTKERIIFK